MSFETAKQVAIDGVVTLIGSFLKPIFTLIAIGVNLVKAFTDSGSAVDLAMDGILSALGDFDGWFETSLNDLLLKGVSEAVQLAAEAVDLKVDPDDPFSADSMTGAVNDKMKTAFRDIYDPELVKEDLILLAVAEVNEALGAQIFKEAEDLRDPERWSALIGALLADGIQESAGAFLAGYACDPANVVLELLCQVQGCHQCMGDDEFEECEARREKAKRNREKYKKKCVRSKR